MLPLEYICEISCGGGSDGGLGCIGNLFRSFKGLSRDEITIPWYYSCRKNLLGITVQDQPSFYHEDGLKHVSAIIQKPRMAIQEVVVGLLRVITSFLCQMI